MNTWDERGEVGLDSRDDDLSGTAGFCLAYKRSKPSIIIRCHGSVASFDQVKIRFSQFWGPTFSFV